MPPDVDVADELDLDFAVPEAAAGGVPGPAAGGVSGPAAGGVSGPAAGGVSGPAAGGVSGAAAGGVPGPAARRRGSKGEQTRAAIVEAALRLFRENGYEATTMRAIAKEAGVATGNAYYYFGSKEELIQVYYARNHAEHAAACRQVLAEQTRLGARMRAVLRALVDVQAPYHSFAAKLYKHAAEPASPLSPFSAASSPTRAAAIALYAEVLEESRIRVPAGLRSRLPELLWLYSMGIVLYWVHDTSPGCEKTYRLIDLTTPLAERLIRLARLPVLRAMTRRLLAVLDEALG